MIRGFEYPSTETLCWRPLGISSFADVLPFAWDFVRGALCGEAGAIAGDIITVSKRQTKYVHTPRIKNTIISK